MSEAGTILRAPARPFGWRGHLVQAGRRLCTTVADLIYPPSCMACREATLEPFTLCPACWSAIRFIERPFCDRLGTPFAQDLGPGLLSPEAIANPPVYSRARAVAQFEDGPVRRIVHRLKYADRMELARPVGRWMARAGSEILSECDLIVPVPLHWRRLFTRRFNQAAALARSISQASGVSYSVDLLGRAKPTPPQVGLTRIQRAENVEAAFKVAPEKRVLIAGRRIVLVDDVLTSGATANAAARVLLRAGAARVDVLVFARVVTAP